MVVMSEPESEYQGHEQDSIEIYCRVRPIFNRRARLSEYRTEQDFEQATLAFRRSKKLDGVYINNTKEILQFKFNGIFDAKSKQPEVFDRVARKCIMSALDGYNSTVFCYGQTGSGKTWTMTGGSESYEERGIIPRAISVIFEEIEKRKDLEYSVSVSFMEIYNDQGYDLLDNNRDVKDIKDLPKVHVREDAHGSLLLSNIVCKQSKIEDDALDALFIGDNNKMMSETAMNEASSRSHCIFTFNIESKVPQSSRVKVSKLHLVDLAGSERVYKSDTVGTTLAEAKYINQSLHYLEMVIVALSENRSHVPYRNSLMTTVLRDSIGGNCKTVMIATINPDLEQFEEAISTCRFSQRVARVKQHAVQNEKLDPQSMIRKLKKEVSNLKEELSFYQPGKDALVPLELHEKELIRKRIEEFVDTSEEEAVLELGGDHSRIREAFFIFKELLKTFKHSGGGTAMGRKANVDIKDVVPSMTEGQTEELKVLRKQLAEAERKISTKPLPYVTNNEQLINLAAVVKMREHEIEVLVSMLEKKKPKEESEIAIQTDLSSDGSTLHSGDTPKDIIERTKPVQSQKKMSSQDVIEEMRRRMDQKALRGKQQEENTPSSSVFSNENVARMVNTLGMVNRAKAFEQFRASYRKKDVIDKAMESVRTKMTAAKKLALLVEEGRTKIGPLKEKLVQLRTEQTITTLSKNGPADQSLNEHYRKEEEETKRQILFIKEEYMQNISQLKTVKSEILYLQNGIENQRKKLQRDFDEWFKTTRQARDEQMTEIHTSASVEIEGPNANYSVSNNSQSDDGGNDGDQPEPPPPTSSGPNKTGAWKNDSDGEEGNGLINMHSSVRRSTTTTSSLSSLLEQRRQRHQRGQHLEQTETRNENYRDHTGRGEISVHSSMSSISNSPSPGTENVNGKNERKAASDKTEDMQSSAEPMQRRPTNNPYMDKLARYAEMRSKLANTNASTTSNSLLERSRMMSHFDRSKSNGR